VTRSRTEIGARAESLAADHLVARGLVPIARNYRTKAGEIDLIMRHDATLVFVEVRYRSRTLHGSPEETIDARKRRRIVRAAAYYLTTLAVVPDCRFDVVSIVGDRPGEHSCEWLQAAFDTSDSTWRG
jgi:putative endonuclease